MLLLYIDQNYLYIQEYFILQIRNHYQNYQEWLQCY